MRAANQQSERALSGARGPLDRYPELPCLRDDAAHQGGQALRAEFSAPDVQYTRDDKPARFWGLNGSASRKGQTVTLTIVNPDVSKTMETQIALRGGSVARVFGTVLASSDMHAHNTFDQPNAVMLATLPVALDGGLMNVSIPPASVARLDVSLG